MTRVSTSTIKGRPLAISNHHSRLGVRLRDYLELIKPRIVALELVTVAAAAYVASPRDLNGWLLVHALVGAGLVAASAGAINQWLEREADSRMQRTANRPLPQGRLSKGEVLLFGAVTLCVGALQLALLVNPVAAGFGLATWLVYVVIYTPLKSRSPVNTAVGAVSGALPVLLGWTATGTPIDSRALAMAGVLFLWQFPHFMAIAWLHRDDYARARYRMLTVVDPTGLRAGAQAVVAALLLIPVSLVPALDLVSASPAVYGIWAIILGTAQLIAAICFMTSRNDVSARRLLRSTLLYLPCWMLLLVMMAL
ncbi:MAG: heme o synthase [Pirellulales bacterium]|nr:heme o synthase [Pirellulales bacterium]